MLQLWTVGHTPDTPSITLEKSMELDGGVFSCVFDSKLEVVSEKSVTACFSKIDQVHWVCFTDH